MPLADCIQFMKLMFVTELNPICPLQIAGHINI